MAVAAYILFGRSPWWYLCCWRQCRALVALMAILGDGGDCSWRNIECRRDRGHWMRELLTCNNKSSTGNAVRNASSSIR